jgi:predicted lipase
MKRIIDYGKSKVIAAIFSTSNSLIVAFRGSITYEEFLMMDTNSATSRTPYNQIITSAVNEVYYANSLAIGEQIKKDVLELIGDKKLYVIGHGFGGALANAMAADFTFNTPPSSAIPIDAIYTFGACYFAGINMANLFNNQFENVSYQILRPEDQIATALKTLPYWNPVNTTVTLLGSLDVPEDTSHSFSAYLSLLDPSRGISSSPQHSSSSN